MSRKKVLCGNPRQRSKFMLDKVIFMATFNSEAFKVMQL
jgi:hypothetical protein